MSNETKYTPGPWRWVNSATDEPYDFSADQDDFGYADGHPSLRTVARDNFSWISRGLPKWILDAQPLQHGNDEANAALIAAAPELYEALTVFAEHFGPLRDNELLSDDVRRCFSLARAALAKARGEQ